MANLIAEFNAAFAIVAIMFFGAVTALRADIITVSNTNDSGPGSLHQALTDANDSDTIEFAVTGTITLTSGELLVDRSIAITAPGPDVLTVARAQNAPLALSADNKLMFIRVDSWLVEADENQRSMECPV